MPPLPPRKELELEKLQKNHLRPHAPEILLGVLAGEDGEAKMQRTSSLSHR